MRGAPEGLDLGNTPTRIIPADAGSTFLFALEKWDLQDHPRGCGEHIMRAFSVALKCGSSPRMRGARLQGARRILVGRIIPADAGSTRRTG